MPSSNTAPQRSTSRYRRPSGEIFKRVTTCQAGSVCPGRDLAGWTASAWQLGTERVPLRRKPKRQLHRRILRVHRAIATTNGQGRLNPGPRAHALGEVIGARHGEEAQQGSFAFAEDD